MNLEAIRAGIRNSTTIVWPGTESPIRLRVLSKASLQDSTFAARRWFEDSKIVVDLVTIEAFKDEETIQILYRSLSDSETSKPLSSSVDVFRSSVTTDELSELAKAYQAFEAEVSPNVDAMTDEEVEKFLRRLKKKPDETIDSVTSIAFARRLLRFSVSQPPS